MSLKKVNPHPFQSCLRNKSKRVCDSQPSSTTNSVLLLLFSRDFGLEDGSFLDTI